MLPALAVLAGSALLRYRANKEANDRRRSIQRSMEAFQRARSRESMAATEEMLKKQTPEARGSELANVTNAREQSLRETVGAAQAFDASPVAGTGSDYQRTQESHANTIAERTRRAIEQLAGMGAPGEQRLQHNLRFGRAAGVVDASNSASDAVGRAYTTDISNVRPDPFTLMLADIGTGAGTGMAIGAAGADAPVANNGQGYEDASGNLYSDNTTRQRRLNRGFSLWGR